MKSEMPLLEVLLRARAKLQTEGVKPAWIKLSPNAHEALVQELSKRNGKKHNRIFEILGMRVDIEEDCPAGGGYMGGNDHE